MKEFPRTSVAGVSLPRMLIGTNWVLGYSHTSQSADAMIRRRYQDRQAVCDLICAYLEYGIDAVMAPFMGDWTPQNPVGNTVLMDGIHMAEDKMARKVILIDTPWLNIEDTPEGLEIAERKIEAVAKNGATFCMTHQSNTDALVNKHTQTLDRLPVYTKLIRKYGMIPGVSTHLPETIQYCDAHPEYDVQTYIQLYNCMGFLMQLEIEGVRNIIETAKKPVMSIKAMAAGRCSPYVGLTFSFASLRDCDMVTVGAHTPAEVHEDVEIALAALERRCPKCI